MTNIARKRLEDEAARLTDKYGEKAGALGSEQFKLNVVPTGSLALDYALGTGGWPLGRFIHLFGAPDIGKSSILGFAALRNAQAMGKFTGIIAVEPGFDPAWAVKNGVDPDLLVVARPDNGQDAMDILYDWVTGEIIDFIVFDSIGAVVNPKESQHEGVSQVGGSSNLITMGIRRVLMPTWKYNKGVILLNQVRDDMKSRFGAVKPPGGHLLTHACDIWVHLRQSSGGADAVKTIKEGDADVVVARNLTAHITRNKHAMGSGQKAKFWYYLKDSKKGPVGIDVAEDIIATGIRTGVIKKAGSYYGHSSFPGKNHNVLGKSGVADYLAEKPKVLEQIREEVMDVMLRETKPVGRGQKPDLTVIAGEGQDG